MYVPGEANNMWSFPCLSAHIDHRMINTPSSWLDRYCCRFPNLDLTILQSYLKRFVYLFRVHQAEGKWPKTVSSLSGPL